MNELSAARPKHLKLWETALSTRRIASWVCPWAVLDVLWKKRTLYLPEIEWRFLSQPASGLDIVPIVLFRLWENIKRTEFFFGDRHRRKGTANPFHNVLKWRDLHLFHMLPWQHKIYALESHEIIWSDGANSSLMPSDEEKNRGSCSILESESVLSEGSLRIKGKKSRNNKY